MPNLILIKHSLPQIEEAAPAKIWRLSSEGRFRCAALAERLLPYAPDVFIASREPKATETGQIVADVLRKPLLIVEGLHEHDRTNVGYLGRKAFEQAVRTFFERPDQLVFGSETADAAYRRFTDAVSGQIAQHPAQNLAVVAHGTVISLFVSRAAGIEAGIEPFALWQQLGLPSFVVLDAHSFALEQIVDAV